MIIDGVEYVRADEKTEHPKERPEDWYIVRTYASGVFAGRLVEYNCGTTNGKLIDSRRLWYWSGAAALELVCVGNPGDNAE